MSIKSTIAGIDEQQGFSAYVRVKPLEEESNNMKQQDNLSFRTKTQDNLLKIEKVVTTVESEGLIVLRDPEYRYIDKREKVYAFDGVLNSRASNEDVFKMAVQNQLDQVLEGFNSSLLVYGITGSGKTHTVFGKDNERGVCQMAVEYLLSRLDNTNSYTKFSFLEVYNENVRDLLDRSLLNPKNLQIVEDPISKLTIVQELQEIKVTSMIQVKDLISEGSDRRMRAATSSNQFSSRSHAVLIFQVIQQKESETISSKLTIIDLAGSEKASSISEKQGKSNFEGSNINKSLLALGNCINTLAEKKKLDQYIPYRHSKLTRIIKDSLGGNTKTVMIACVSQQVSCLEETFNTLNYASRATQIKRKVVRNFQASEMSSLQQQNLIQELQSQLSYYQQREKNMCCDTPRERICTEIDEPFIKSIICKDIETEKKTVERKIFDLQDQLKVSQKEESNCGAIFGDLPIQKNYQDSQEEFVDRICEDLSQNAVESHQLTTSLQEIESILVRDYKILISCQRGEFQNYVDNKITFIEELKESIKENEEIKNKMKSVLDTNQEQKSHLKQVLIKLAQKRHIVIEYEVIYYFNNFFLLQKPLIFILSSYLDNKFFKNSYLIFKFLQQNYKIPYSFLVETQENVARNARTI